MSLRSFLQTKKGYFDMNSHHYTQEKINELNNYGFLTVHEPSPKRIDAAVGSEI